MKILVVHGGEGLSDEAEVSYRTGAMIVDAIRELGYVVEEYLLTKGNLSQLAEKMGEFDLVWPALHGKFGEDGEFQKVCEDNGAKFVGSGSDASLLCFDKNLYKQKLLEWGIATPQYQLVRMGEVPSLPFPLCLKPIASGSSVDTFKIGSEEQLRDIYDQLGDKYEQMMAEEWIQGIECTVGILGDMALPMIEIVPPSTSGFFDLEAKYSGHSEEICPPVHISEKMQKLAGLLARDIHRKTGCRHLSRTDMIIRDEDLYVLETNTLPGMTPQSLFPKAAMTAGLNFPTLVKKMIGMALS